MPQVVSRAALRQPLTDTFWTILRGSAPANVANGTRDTHSCQPANAMMPNAPSVRA